jgi:hypothetical protein
LLYANAEEERRFGALLEAGAALANGKRIFLVAPYPWPFLRHHPRCRSFDTLSAAVEAIMAAVNGERSRREIRAA